MTNDTVNAQKTTPPVLFNLKTLSGALRVLGAGVLVVAVSIYLFQGWSHGSDVGRYLMLLALTVALAGLGFASGHWLRETTGARLFLTLALASLPANFTILGAFIYSRAGAVLANYPAFATWQVGNLSVALGLTAAAAVVLVPVAVLGFMVLARRSALPLTAVYVVTNAALLLPVRDATTIGWLVLGLAVSALMGVHFASRNDSTLRTVDGFIARALAFLPIVVIVVRATSFYTMNDWLFATIAVTVFLLLRHLGAHATAHPGLRVSLERLSVLPAAAASACLADLAVMAFPVVQPSGFSLFTVLMAGFLVEISTRAVHGGGGYRRAAALVVSAGLLANLAAQTGVISAVLCLAGGLAILVYGYLMAQRLVFASGAVVLAAGLGYQIYLAVTVFNLGGWGSLAVLGIVAILAGSLLDRYGAALKSVVRGWGQRFRTWDY